MKFNPLLAGLLLASGAQAQKLDESGPKLPAVLKRAMMAGPKLRYTGKRLVEVLKGPRPSWHSELISRDGIKTRIEFSDDSSQAGQIIVEVGPERKHFFPDRNEILILPAKREEAFQRLGRIGRGGRSSVTTSSGEVVAGLRTEQVVVSDESGNVSQRLFIEPKSGVLLKRTMFDGMGTMIASFAFTEINLNPPRFDSSLFRIERKGALVVTPRDLLRRLLKGTSYLDVSLPANSDFRLESSRIMSIGGDKVLVQFYGSSNKRLSFFQAQGPINFGRFRKFGPRDVKVYNWEFNGRTWALVGNLDESTLAQIAKSTGSGTP